MTHIKYAILALLLSGCASEPYWYRVTDPVLVLHVVEVDRPGGRTDLDGYANRRAHTIELRRGLRPAMRECVLSHEMKHFAGYAHIERKGFATDCGDGRIISP